MIWFNRELAPADKFAERARNDASVNFCFLRILGLCVIMKSEGRDKGSPPASGGNFFEEATPSDNLEQETQLNKEVEGAQSA